MPYRSISQKQAIAVAYGMVTRKTPMLKQLRPTRPRATTVVPPSKNCSYCGGPVGQGFKQITVPKMAVVRMCALCNLKMVNWAMAKIKEEEINNAVEAVVDRSEKLSKL